MGKWHVQRTFTPANGPPRNEWLRARPDFYPIGATLPSGAVTSEDVIDCKWTRITATDPVTGAHTWSNGEPHDFGRRKAEKWASLLGSEASAIRFGSDDEVIPPMATEDDERAKKERRRYAAALAAGEEPN